MKETFSRLSCTSTTGPTGRSAWDIFSQPLTRPRAWRRRAPWEQQFRPASVLRRRLWSSSVHAAPAPGSAVRAGHGLSVAPSWWKPRSRRRRRAFRDRDRAGLRTRPAGVAARLLAAACWRAPSFAMKVLRELHARRDCDKGSRWRCAVAPAIGDAVGVRPGSRQPCRRSWWICWLDVLNRIDFVARRMEIKD